MTKWVIDFEHNEPEGAVEDLMDDLDQELILNGSEFHQELTEQLNTRLAEVGADIQAGLNRPEFAKAIEDAKQRIYQALRDAFSYRRR